MFPHSHLDSNPVCAQLLVQLSSARRNWGMLSFDAHPLDEVALPNHANVVE
jgi:hypothetical protein